MKSTTVNLSDSGSQHIVDWNGVTDNYQPVTFNVPQGQNRLNAAIAFQNADAPTGLNARVRLTLVDPQGNLAEYSVPQGDGNYGDVQVANPVPGTWTAYVYSRNSVAGGTTGNVVFGASVAKYSSFGHASPSTLTLAPGQSGAVMLRVSTPSQPGDAAGSIMLSSNQGAGFGRVTTIPVTLRSLIPNGSQSFSGTLTGGNGRETQTGEEFSYQFDLPSGRPELNAAVTLGDNPNNPLSAWLINPTGEAVAFAANVLPDGSASDIGAQLHVLSPAGGAWTLIVAYAPFVSGTTLSEPFTVTTSQSAVPASAPGLPSSTSTKLPAGQPVSAMVRIRNTGPAPEAYFLDARLPTSSTLTLASLTGSSTVPEPIKFGDNVPEYLIPTNTTSWTATAGTTGPAPIQFDSGSPAGDPDILSPHGTSVSASFSANPISQGLWAVAPTEVGPYVSGPGPSETVTTTMSAVSAMFDPTVTSPTGDLWTASTDPSQLNNYNPVVVNPGQTATIPVTITPDGPSGTQVGGTLYVDDGDNFLFDTFVQPNGNQVAAIPYSYTVK